VEANEPVRIVSWNVNGLRACARKGFSRWLGRSGAEIVGLQEVRALPEQLPPNLQAPRR
jgi:exodeoxyribonuclease-3